MFRKHFLIFIFIIISVFAVYSNSLKASFHLDDSQIFIRTNLHLSEINFKSLKETAYFTPFQRYMYRPIPCLSLALNYYFGRTDSFGYHIVNISIHILCAISVYIFLLLLLSIPHLRPVIASEYRYEIAAIATFLFALHPIQTNVATYIIQRMTSIAALFYIISFTGYIQFRIGTLPDQTQTKRKMYTSLTICIVSAIFAILSKENTAILPVIILFADYLLFYRYLSESGQKISRRVYSVIVFFILCVLAYEGPKQLFNSVDMYRTRDFSLVERLMTESRIVFFYLYQLVVPNIGQLNLSHDFSISSGFITPPQTLISLIGIIFLLVSAYRSKDKNNLISFAIVWYFGNLVIESTVIPLELVFEHRTYLPGVLVFCMMALGMISLGCYLHRKKMMVVFVAIMLVLFGNTTYLRNGQFKTKFSLWSDAVEKSQGSTRAHVYLGNAYTERGYLEEGRKEYETALMLNPNMPEALLNLGKYYKKHGDFNRARSFFKKALIQYPKTKLYLICISLANIADIYGAELNYDNAVLFYKAALRRVPFYVDAIHNLAITKIHQGNRKSAEAIFKNGMHIDPGYTNFYTSLAKLLSNEKRYKEAVDVLNKYISKNENSKNVILLSEHIKKKWKIYKETKQN